MGSGKEMSWQQLHQVKKCDSFCFVMLIHFLSSFTCHDIYKLKIKVLNEVIVLYFLSRSCCSLSFLRHDLIGILGGRDIFSMVVYSNSIIKKN